LTPYETFHDGSYGFISAQYTKVETGFSEAVSMEQVDSMKKALAEMAEEVAEKKAAALEEQAKESEEEKEPSEQTDASSEDESTGSEADDSREVNEKKTETDTKTEEKKEEKKEEKEEKKEEKKEETKEETSGSEKEEEKAETETNASDLYLLAAIVYCEAGAEPYEGQLAVANVVINRLNTGKWGNTLADVIYAPYQFTGCQMSSFSTALKTGGSASCLRAAQEALNGNNSVPGYYYFRPYKNVALEKLSNYTIIGTHVYY
jgi:spore germination cell wall hydrolase CwlJ-like protein